MSGTQIRFNFINSVTSLVVVVSLQEVKRLIDIVTGLKNISEYGTSGGTLIMEVNGNQEKDSILF